MGGVALKAHIERCFVFIKVKILLVINLMEK